MELHSPTCQKCAQIGNSKVANELGRPQLLSYSDCFLSLVPQLFEVTTQVESRPMTMHTPVDGAASGRHFEYLFYVDFAGNLADDSTQNALWHLAELAPFLRVLGCYPCDSAI